MLSVYTLTALQPSGCGLRKDGSAGDPWPPVAS